MAQLAHTHVTIERSPHDERPVVVTWSNKRRIRMDSPSSDAPPNREIGFGGSTSLATMLKSAESAGLAIVDTRKGEWWDEGTIRDQRGNALRTHKVSQYEAVEEGELIDARARFSQRRVGIMRQRLAPPAGARGPVFDRLLRSHGFVEHTSSLGTDHPEVREYWYRGEARGTGHRVRVNRRGEWHHDGPHIVKHGATASELQSHLREVGFTAPPVAEGLALPLPPPGSVRGPVLDPLLRSHGFVERTSPYLTPEMRATGVYYPEVREYWHPGEAGSAGHRVRVNRRGEWRHDGPGIEKRGTTADELRSHLREVGFAASPVAEAIVRETTTGASVGGGLASPMATGPVANEPDDGDDDTWRTRGPQNAGGHPLAPTGDDAAAEFYAKHGSRTARPAALHLALIDFAQARGMTGDQTRALQDTLDKKYNVRAFSKIYNHSADL